MSKKNYSVARVVTHTQSSIGKCERHNERKNESYANMNVDTARCDVNVHFKSCGELTYNEQLNKLIAEKKVCMRGLKVDAKVFDEVIFDVNTDYFETHGGYEYAKEFYAEAYRFAVNLYGEQNIISAVMHADELNVALTEQHGKHGYKNTMFFVDDGISGTTFDRPDFQRMEHMIEAGEIGTVIVKDLSRFGREHILFDHYTQVLYPSLGVNFISIQENVETISGKGTEMMPFHNLFNEWYASQTSKKVRQVWKSKSDNGERVSPTVAFGYKKDKDNPKQWIIDEPAAEIVRYIYQLALEGLGVTKIARRLEREEILTPTAYYNSIGRKTRNPITTSYRWSENSIEKILNNLQYTGCTVNFKSSTVSYKVHKRISFSEDDWVVIPNTQEPIIDMDTWERVQEIKKHRRRNTATGRESIFSGLVYCGDCGSRLYFCAAKSINENQEFFRCSAYKENRGSCSIHYIRNVVLEKMVLKTIREAAEYITEHERLFLYLFAKQHKLSIANNLKEAKYELEKNKKRIQELDKLIEAVFEQNVLGKLPDDRYNRMLTNYEKEQKDLMQKVEVAEKLINTAQQENIDVRNFLSNIRQCTDLKELTPTLVNKLIDKIEVFDRVRGEDGKKHVPIKIHFVGVGVMQFPDTEMLEKAKEEMKAYAKKAS